MRIFDKCHIYLFSLFLSVCLLSNCSSERDKKQSNDLVNTSGISQSSLPHFTLRTLDGNMIASQEFEGHVLVVDFWATWCRPCITEIPKYNTLNAKFQGKNFRFVGVTMDSGDFNAVKPFVSKFNIEYPIYVGDPKVANAFGGVQGYPMTFVIDKSGTVQKSYLGIAKDKAEEIGALVERLLKESS